jgi:DNA-binding NarL/FixJ family response regulator
VSAGQNNSARRGRSPISVLVADELPIICDGVKNLLERHPDIRVIAAVGDASAALKETLRLVPRIVVMDITIPGMNGIEAIRILADRLPATRVIVFSMHSTPITVRRAVEAGAYGYVSKKLPSEELVRAVRAVAAGKRYKVQRLLAVHKGFLQGEHMVELLTTTERSILELVANGKTNSQVAATIGLTPRTVETYRLRVMRKLGLENLPSLVRYAIRHGFIALE